MRVNPLALAASFPYLICHGGGQQRVGGWPDELLQWIGSGQQAAAWAFWFALQKKKKVLYEFMTQLALKDRYIRC